MCAKDYLGKIVAPKGMGYVCVITGVPKTERNLTPSTIVMVEFPYEIYGYTHRCTFVSNETHYLIDRIKNIPLFDRPEIYRYYTLRELVILKN